MIDSVSWLRTPAAIRERAGQMLKYVEDGRSAWFALDAAGLEAAVQATLAVTRQRFSDPSKIPFHSRWRHFEAGGRDRWAGLAERLKGLPPEEIARIRDQDFANAPVEFARMYLCDARDDRDARFRQEWQREGNNLTIAILLRL